jgi:hypothetical protein
MRPKCVASRHAKNLSKGLVINEDTFPFFITPHGGRLNISNILKKNTGMGTRDIRSKVVTETCVAVKCNVITREDQKAILFSQGHSETISNAFYLKPNA